MEEKSNKFYEITGIVHKILDEQTFSSGFRKRDLILTDDIGSKYPRYIPFTFKKDRADLLKSLNKGQRVRVVFVIDGREYNGKYFADITGIKVDYAPDEVCPPSAEPSNDFGPTEQDELPF